MSITSTADPNSAAGVAPPPAVLNDRLPLIPTVAPGVARLSSLRAPRPGSVSTSGRRCHGSRAQCPQFQALSGDVRLTARPSERVFASAAPWSCDIAGRVHYVAHRLKVEREWLSCHQFTRIPQNFLE